VHAIEDITGENPASSDESSSSRRVDV